ncbi:hypothetical protein AB3S75_029375, partial [Citrus x aurantiifolia]
MATLLAKACRS